MPWLTVPGSYVGVTQRVGVWPANPLAAAYLLALNSRWVVRELRLFAAHAKLRPVVCWVNPSAAESGGHAAQMIYQE